MASDQETLVAFNRDYIDSVQNSDVKRFDEILAKEFYCSNPDRSLVDRAQFLKQTEKPVAIKNLKAKDVLIRIMGMLRSFTRGRATGCRTEAKALDVIRMSGPGRTANGSPCPLTSRDKSRAQLAGSKQPTWRFHRKACFSLHRADTDGLCHFGSRCTGRWRVWSLSQSQAQSPSLHLSPDRCRRRLPRPRRIDR